MEMNIQDDALTLRSAFSGFYRVIHFLAVVAFAAPYAVFLARQYLQSEAPGSVMVGDDWTTILEALARFVYHGSENWATASGWSTSQS